MIAVLWDCGVWEFGGRFVCVVFFVCLGSLGFGFWVELVYWRFLGLVVWFWVCWFGWVFMGLDVLVWVWVWVLGLFGCCCFVVIWFGVCD